MRPSVLDAFEPGELVRLATTAGFHPAAFAKLCGVSLRTLERDFQKHLGFPPEIGLENIRLNLASAQSSETSRTKELAYGVGYKHPSYFCRRFKKVFGRSLKQAGRTAYKISTREGASYSQRMSLKCNLLSLRPLAVALEMAAEKNSTTKVPPHPKN